MVANRQVGPAMRERQAPVISADKVFKDLDSRIMKLRKSTDDVAAEIQSLIVDISKHCIGLGNGDITRAAKLIDALPRWVRRADIIRYWGMFSPVVVVKDTKTEGLMRASLRKDDRATNKESKFVPWNIAWAEKPENSFFNYIAGLKEPGWFEFEEVEKQVILLANRLEMKLKDKSVHVTDDETRSPKEILTEEQIKNNFVVVKASEENNIVKFIGGLKKLHNEYKLTPPVVQVQKLEAEVEPEEEREALRA